MTRNAHRMLLSFLLPALWLGGATPFCAHAQALIDNSLDDQAATSKGLYDSADDIGMTGTGMTEIDTVVRDFMARFDVPGYALAISVNEQLVVARGYGLADQARRLPVEPTSLFRVASVSKPITAISAMTLAQSGHLELDAPAFPSFLPDLSEVAAAANADNISRITTAHLLSHTSGWQFRNFNRDMVFDSRRIATVMNVPSPAGPESTIEYVLRFEPLHAMPGSSYSYDNFNYMVAGRVIESITQRPYEDFVRSRVLAPIGVHRSRVGGALFNDRFPGEVRYYPRGSEDTQALSVFGSGGLVPVGYGNWDHPGIDSVGGWIASAPDLVRLMTAIDARDTLPDLLDGDARERLGRNPGPPVYAANAEEYYALGWGRDAFGEYWLHDGSLPGTRAIVVMSESGLTLAALINTRDLGATQAAFDSAFIDDLARTVLAIDDWPERDLFEDLGYQNVVVSDETSGAWYDPAHDGEGFLVEVLSADRAVVYWFTYTEDGQQRWFVGDGIVDGHRIRITDLLQPLGGQFGSADNTIELQNVGELTLLFDQCHQGRANYIVDGVSGSQSLSRLIRINNADCRQPGDPIALTQDSERAVSGSWFDAADPGEGFIVQRLSDDSAATFWFTFDNNGQQRWMTGIGEPTDNGWHFPELLQTSGGLFGPDFDPTQVQRTPWGDLTLNLNCATGTADYNPTTDGFQPDQQPLTRLTHLAGQTCPDP